LCLRRGCSPKLLNCLFLNPESIVYLKRLGPIGRNSLWGQVPIVSALLLLYPFFTTYVRLEAFVLPPLKTPNPNEFSESD